MTQVDLWTLEAELCTPDTQPLCGVDEAGRGPLAGPVCAAAVMLPPGLVIPGLNDSKKLSEKKREALYDIIRAAFLAGWRSAGGDPPQEQKLFELIPGGKPLKPSE